MADTWGATTLNVQAYHRPGAEINLSERRLVPDPSSSSPQSVLTGGGRLRLRRGIEGWATKTDFDSLNTDYEAQTSRTVTFEDGFSMTAVIEKLDGEMEPGFSEVFYTATFVEL